MKSGNMHIRYEYTTYKYDVTQDYKTCPRNTEIYDIELTPNEIKVNGWAMPIRPCSIEFVYKLRKTFIYASESFFDGHLFKQPFDCFWGYRIIKHVMKYGKRK